MLDWSVENITPDMTQYVIQLGVSAILILSVIIVCRDNHGKKSLKIPKGGNQNPYIEAEQTIFG